MLEIERINSEWNKLLYELSDEKLHQWIEQYEEEIREIETLMKRLRSSEVPSFVDISDQMNTCFTQIYDLNYDIEQMREILRLRAVGYDIITPKVEEK